MNTQSLTQIEWIVWVLCRRQMCGIPCSSQEVVLLGQVSMNWERPWSKPQEVLHSMCSRSHEWNRVIHIHNAFQRAVMCEALAGTAHPSQHAFQRELKYLSIKPKGREPRVRLFKSNLNCTFQEHDRKFTCLLLLHPFMNAVEWLGLSHKTRRSDMLLAGG